MTGIAIFGFCHLAACFWYLTATLSDDFDNWVFYFGYIDSTNFSKYLAAFYFIITTGIFLNLYIQIIHLYFFKKKWLQ